eukprot:909442_1
MAQSDDSDSEIDPVEALLTTMPVPQNYPRFTLTTADFEEAYGGKEEYDKRVDDIKMAPYISSIEEMNSWRPMFANADQITDQFLRELVVQTERLNSATFCMHLVLVGSATETNRILRNKDEEDSFLGWFGHAYQTFWTKKGAHSVEYMSNTWMDGRYKISEWCCYESEARTNNVSESLNFVTRELFGRHPLYDVWIEKLALQMASHLSRHEQYKIWKKTNKRPNKEILKNEVISNEWLRIKTDESASSILLFLQRVSKSMKVGKAALKRMLDEYECQAK